MHLLYQKVRNSEEHYRLVSQNAGDGVLVSDGEGCILNANPAIKEITGVAPDPSTGGYWLVGTDGGVFAFAAPFFGAG